MEAGRRWMVWIREDDDEADTCDSGGTTSGGYHPITPKQLLQQLDAHVVGCGAIRMPVQIQVENYLLKKSARTDKKQR
jgi:hypothetical protein